MLCTLITGMSQAQVTTGTSINSEPISQDLTSFTHDQVEDFIIQNYSYSNALEDLQVTNDYRINKSLTQFVFNHITGFYTLVYNGIEQHQITSSNQLQTMYLNFIDTTKSVISNTPFIDKPIINNIPPAKQLNGPCVNMDFEDGNLNGWDLFDGKVDGTVPYSYINSVPVGPGASHLIVTTGNDPVVGIPMVNPDGGTFSCRLGDGTGTGYNAAKMTQTFMVTPGNSIFSYSYAVVFQDPGHPIAQQPYFSVRVYDQFGNNINCGTYNVVAGGGLQGFQNGPGGVLYKDWTTVFSQLSAYVGQNITIEFTTGDCGQGGHYGYAYVDANCQPFDITTSTGDTVICAGDTMTLFAPQGGSSYLWNTGATTSSIDISTGGHYTVDIIPVQGNLCAITLDINIVELPVPVAIFTANPTQVCIGDDIIFNDASTVANPSVINTWQWDFGDGIYTPASSGNVLGVTRTSGTYTAANHLYNTTGTFNVTLTVEASSYHCANSVTHQVQVNAMPTLTIVGDTIVCNGEQTTLTASGASTYSWDHGITNGTAFTPPLGTTVYTVTGTAVGGCEKTKQITVIANALPVVGYTVTDNEVCDGTPVTLTGTGATTYSWDNGISNGVAFVQAIGTTVYTVTGTNINGCTDTAQASITVHALPVVGINVSDDEVCQGTSVILAGTGASTYTWNHGVTNGVSFIQAVGTTVYNVTGTDVNGCTDTAQVAVIVHALPSVFALGDTVCNGDMVTLSGQNAATYSWNHGVTDGIAFTPALGSTNYTVTGTDVNGCKNVYTVNVMVNPLPHIVAGQDFSICAGTSAILTGSGAGIGGIYTWDNGVVDGVSFSPADTTTYTVIGTDVNGCTGTDQATIIVVPIPVVDFTADKLKGCSPLEPVFTNNSTGILTDCQWSFSNGENLVGCGSVSTSFGTEGCYDVTLTVSTPEGCANTMTKTDYVCVLANPVADFYTDPKELSTVNWEAGMINESVGGDTYHWDFGDGSSASTAFEPKHAFPNSGAGTYLITLTVTSVDGCIDFVSRPITVTDELIYYVPNAFTPDNDNYNEAFKPVFGTGYDPQGYTLYIFNRWGDLLFESHNTDVGWDGKFNNQVVEDGVYIWKIIIKHKDSDDKDMRIGNVSLLR